MKKWLPLFAFYCSSILWISCESTSTTSDYTGIWKVVTIKKEKLNIPPSGAWFEINGNSYTMGKGEITTDSGTIGFISNEIIAIQSKIKVDNDSEWLVRASNDTLIWQGTDTKVNSNGLTMYMVKTKIKPQHPSEEILGKWSVQAYIQDSVEVDNPFGEWIEFYPNGKCLFHPSDSGTWSMNPHVPVMNTQCPSKQLLNQWLVSFDENTTKWTGTSTFQQDNLSLTLRKE